MHLTCGTATGRCAALLKHFLRQRGANRLQLGRLVQEMAPDGLVSPCLVLVKTDPRHYNSLTPNCFRFAPMRIDEDDLSRMHGVDERLSFEDCVRMVQSYIAFLKDFDNLVKEQRLVPEAFASEYDDLPLLIDFEDEF